MDPGKVPACAVAEARVFAELANIEASVARWDIGDEAAVAGGDEASLSDGFDGELSPRKLSWPPTEANTSER